MCHHLYEASKQRAGEQARRTDAQDTRQQNSPIAPQREPTERHEEERRVELEVE